jgi:hypothetical protein
MLFMVIENFKQANVKAVGERFAASGRMLPEGLRYQASWMETSGSRCFQIVETDDPTLLSTWISRWNDLVDFEVVSVETSAEFWAKSRPASGN